MIFSHFNKEQSARAMQASAYARHSSEFAQEKWNHDPLDLMSVAQFEQWLVAKWGPEYLEPVDYRRAGESLVPIKVVANA